MTIGRNKAARPDVMECSSSGDARRSPLVPDTKTGGDVCYGKHEWSMMVGRDLSATSQSDGHVNVQERARRQREERCRGTDSGTEVTCSGGSGVPRLTKARDCRARAVADGSGHQGLAAPRAVQDAAQGSLGSLE